MSKARELASLGNAYSDGALSNRNLIINGAMQVAQRGTSYVLNSNGYTLDRWKTISIHGQQTVAQQAVTDLAGFSKCIRVQRNVGSTANAYSIELNQPVESLNTISVVGKTVTLSFWARVGSDYSGDVDAFTSTIAYHNYTGVDMGMEEGDFLATFASTKVVQANTPSTDWTYYTMTADIASDAYQVGVVIATQSWVGTAGANDYFEVTGVQLEVGDTATPFEHRSYGQELALCQRYYELGNGYAGGRYSDNLTIGSAYFSTAKRAIPSVSLSGSNSPTVVSATASFIGWYAVGLGTNYSNQMTYIADAEL